MRIQCDACEGAAATVVCCADEAALCARCDVQIHAANKLASKHQRLPLQDAAAAGLPRCDVCQDKPAFVFCVDDRALFCRDCDDSIHVQGTLSANHQRYIATGIRVGFSSVCSAHADSHPPPQPPPSNSKSKPTTNSVVPRVAPVQAAAQEVPSSPFLPSSGWAVEDLLQFSDYESSDKKGSPSPLGFKELEWFADIDLFHHDQALAPQGGRTAAEVPEIFASPLPASNAGFYYKTTGARQSKKARVELPDDDDEDYLVVPDLG